MAAQDPFLQGVVGSVPSEIATPPKSWLGRNWKKLLLIVPLGALVFVGAILVLVMGGIRNSEVAKEAAGRAQTNPLVVERLGNGITEGWLMSGTINVNGASGDADLAVPISGPKGKGTVYVTARKMGGTWNYSQMTAMIDGSSDKIDLLSNGTPVASAAPTSPAQPAEAPMVAAASPPTDSPASAPAAGPSDPQPAGVIQTQETNEEGVVGELTDCRRSEGVLTIKVRYRNTSSKKAHLTFTHWNAHGDDAKYYVTAGNKKFFMLTDSEGTVLSTNSTGNGVETDLDAGKTFLWWAKYPAPPADVKKINFITPLSSPFEDVPITDK